MEEIWKNVDGFPGYQVSSEGRVKCFRDFHGIITDEFRLLKPLLNKDDYYYVDVYTESGKQVHKRIHRLVADAFLGSQPNLVVNHIDGNKHNNDISNLEWVTPEENSRLAAEAGLYKTRPVKIVETGEKFASIKECAKALNVHPSNINQVISGKSKTVKGLRVEYVTDEMHDKSKKPFLREQQKDAVERMSNGCILNGSVGSGKSRTGLYYFFSKNGGSKENGYVPMKPNPPDLYIITTARKRDTLEWEGELAPFLLSTNPEASYYSNTVVVDSWNNIKKYVDVKGAQFIFDEQRVVGSGAWVNSFLKICKNNEWILLSATAGDKWEDYIPVFIANGFYKNRTEFKREHLVYSNYTKYPQVERYLNTGRLIRLRSRILVDMPVERHTVQIHEDVYVRYDISTYKDVGRLKRDPFSTAYVPCKQIDDGALKIGRDIDISDVTPIMDGWLYEPQKGDYVKLINKPIKNASELCYIWRKIVNTDVSRQVALMELYEKHPKMIVFYNFDYELDILKNIYYGENVQIAEWNGHKHQPIPDGEKWVYLVQYTAGCEGWNCVRTDTIVFFSQNYSYKVMVQAAGRTDRLNTPYTNLYYYHLKSRSGIDLAISRALKEKKKFNETRWVGDKLAA